MTTVEWPLLGKVDTLEGLDETTRRAVTAVAVDYLRRWTGGIYGQQQATIRPFRAMPAVRPASLGAAYGKWLPVPISGGWYSLSCHYCRSQFCACERPTSLRFPFHVHEIVEVAIDGQPFTRWRLDAHRVLYRTDGAGWPAYQRLALDPDEEETFAITLVRGLPVPEGGQIAAAVLAEEIARAVSGDPGCRLPARVQTITRQGVTVGMFDSMDDLSGGSTGLWLVDSWLATVTEAPRAGGVWSPDHDPGRVRYE